MMGGIWAKVVGALVMIIGLMGAALLLLSGQKNRAKEAASRAKAEAKSKSAVMDAERAIDTARAQAREQSAAVKREAEIRPADKRPTGTFRR
jgi:hypothetical protein